LEVLEQIKDLEHKKEVLEDLEEDLILDKNHKDLVLVEQQI